jgi:sugar lactone lactonase YvrE
LVVYSGQRIFATIGPSRAMAMPDGRLYLLSHGKLHVFGADGRRTQAIDLAALGVPTRPSDFEVHRDGRLVITDPNRSVLHRCQLPAGPCAVLDVGLRSVPGQQVLPLNAAKIHIDEAAKRYYISDNYGFRVLVCDFDGKLLAQSQARIVRHPNQLAVRDPGELTVVDTDNRRLLTFDVAGDKLGRILREIDTDAADRVARPGRFLPFDSVRFEDGTTWVLIAMRHMKDADIVEFDASGRARRRIPLDEDSDPFDIELWRGRAWIADATRYRFESVDRNGVRGQVEDRDFLEEVDQARIEPRRWRTIRFAAQAGLALVPLSGVLVLWRLGLAWPGGRAPASLGREPATLAAIRIVLAVATLAMLALVANFVLRLL